MKKVLSVNVFVILVCLFSCIISFVYGEDYEDLLNAVNRQFAKEVKSDYGVIFESGGGELMEDVKRVTLQFKAYHRYSIDEVRPLIVNMSERYLFLMNSNKKVRPYLHNYPFTPFNFSIMLNFLDKADGLCVDPPDIAFVLYSQGDISYYINKREPSGWKSFSPNYEEVCEETIEQASKIVGSESDRRVIN